MGNDKKTILVVEDNPLAAKANAMILEMLGCQVELTDDGDKAVQMIKENHYDGICMDIGLITLSGTEACLAIREHEVKNHLRQVPIVAVTGNNSEEEAKTDMEVGMQAVIEKPLTKKKAEYFLSFCN
ncbi:MAG: response regulator [Tatlockia sp.]|nr:response regulator [Tatlockia sp.]